MSLGTTIDLVAGGSVVGRNQAIVTEQVAVGEPGSLALLGTGLAGVGFALRMRRRSSDGRNRPAPGERTAAAA
jgi:hypothetical protein